MHKIVFLPLFFLLSSCGFFQKAPPSDFKEPTASTAFAGVDWVHSEATDRERSRSSIEIGQGHLRGEFGPQLTSTALQEVSDESGATREPVVAVIMAPALYRSLAYFGFMNEIARNQINGHVFLSQEVSSILSALWLSGVSSHRLEWEMFRLITELRDLSPYGRRWRRELNRFIVDHFSGEHLERLERPLYIMAFNHKESQIKLLGRGLVTDGLKTQSVLNRNRSESELISALEWRVFRPEDAFKMGADIVIYLDALSDRPMFNYRESYLIGAYRKAAGFIREIDLEDNENIIYVNFELGEFALDHKQNLQEIMGRGRNTGQKFSPKIERVIEKWKNREQEALKLESYR